MRLQFLGANRQVTGSRYLLEAAGLKLLIDSGMFQEREFTARNWQAPPFDPGAIDALLLTHAHLDHTGLIPRLVKMGFHGPIYATPPTVDLSRLVLLDSAHLQQEDLDHKQQRHEAQGRSSPHGYEPLYTEEDVQHTMGLFHQVKYDEPLKLNDRLSVTWHDAGHILGSSILELAVNDGPSRQRLVFSGDLGLWDQPLIRDPSLLSQADLLIMESTYGDADHPHPASIEDQLAAAINDTFKRGGNVVVPTFAIERAQELLYYLSKLVDRKSIPHAKVFLDSPMAVDATKVFENYAQYLDDETRRLLCLSPTSAGTGQPTAGDSAQERVPASCSGSPFHMPGLTMTRSADQSKAINQVQGGAVIMAGSGMCTGGRVKHHLIRELPRSQSTILFVGYQGHGTLGREIMDGAKMVRVLGQTVGVQAKVARILGLSAHADRSALLRWASAFKPFPRRMFLTHGEVPAAESLAALLKDRLGVDARIPAFGESVEWQ